MTGPGADIEDNRTLADCPRCERFTVVSEEFSTGKWVCDSCYGRPDNVSKEKHWSDDTPEAKNWWEE